MTQMSFSFIAVSLFCVVAAAMVAGQGLPFGVHLAGDQEQQQQQQQQLANINSEDSVVVNLACSLTANGWQATLTSQGGQTSLSVTDTYYFYNDGTFKEVASASSSNANLCTANTVTVIGTYNFNNPPAIVLQSNACYESNSGCFACNSLGTATGSVAFSSDCSYVILTVGVSASNYYSVPFPLSPGAIAGIIIGVLFGIAILGAVVLLIVRRQQASSYSTLK